MKKILDKILSVIFFISMFLPIFFINPHHDCKSDECIKIFYNEKFGTCIEGAIDSLCFAIAVGVWFIVIATTIIWSKKIEAFSPIVFMVLTELLAIYLAFIDPSKWGFAVSLLLPFVITIIVGKIDRKFQRKKMFQQYFE